MWSEENSQDLIESVLILVLVSVITVAAMKDIAVTLHGAFSNASSNVQSTSGQQVDTQPPHPPWDR